MLVLARIIRAEEGEKSAVQFIVNQLRERPSVRGLAHFIELALLETADASQQTLLLLKEITSRLLKNKPIYKCAECGFNAKTLYWQCPSCKQWNVVKPIQGIDGE
jgi:lipopolysaccharide biosynthesis regulator YciM